MSEHASPLQVVHDSDSVDTDEGDVFEIKNELRTIEMSEHKDLLAIFYDIKMESPTSLPLYELLWRDIVPSAIEQRGSLHELVLLYERLDDYIQRGEYDSIECTSVPYRYRMVVQDVADAHDIEVGDEASTRSIHRRQLRTWGRSLWATALMLGDQFVSLLVRPLVGSRPTGSVAFFPFPSRESSMVPVFEFFDDDITVFRHAIVLAKLSSKNEYLRNYQGHDAINFDLTTTIRAIAAQIIFLIRLLIETFHRKDLEEGVLDHIEDTQGITPRRTVAYAVRTVYSSNLRELLFGILMRDVFRRGEYEAAVVGGMSVRDRAIVAAADQSGVEPFYVPHTIATYPDTLPQPVTTHFVAGSLDERHYRRVYGEEHHPTFAVTGRPYLDRLNRNLEDRRQQEVAGDSWTLVLATQPHVDEIRREFLFDCLQAASTSIFDEVVVKIHPSESTEFYDELLDPATTEMDSVTVTESDLQGNLIRADLVITITSNVAIEAVIANSACICYNKWFPKILPQPFVTDGEIPAVKTSEELREFLSTTDAETLTDLAATETEFVHREYELSPGAAHRIADRIKDAVDDPSGTKTTGNSV